MSKGGFHSVCSRLSLRCSALVVLAVTARPEVAAAHRLMADYTAGESAVHIEFYFPLGDPAAGLVVTAEQPGREAVSVGVTDDKGAVVFVPPGPGAWTIIGKGAAGHSNQRDPLEIPSEVTAKVLGDRVGSGETAASGPAGGVFRSLPRAETGEAPSPSSAPAASRRHLRSFPLVEIAVSLGFIAVLTAVTLWMMRRAEAAAGRSSEPGCVEREVADLRQSVEQLQRQVDTLCRQLESRK